MSVRLLRIGTALSAISILAGCASQNCDPQLSRSVLQAAGCLSSGGTQASVDALEVQRDRTQAAAEIRQLEARAQQREAAAAAVEVAALEGRLLRIEQEISDVSRSITGVAAQTQSQTDRIGQLNFEITQAQSEITLAKRLADEQRRQNAIDATNARREIQTLEQGIMDRKARIVAMKAALDAELSMFRPPVPDSGWGW